MGEPHILLLGEIAIRDGGSGPPRTTRSTLLRTLLALLAITPGRVVNTDVLVDELWGEDLPQDPRGALAIQVTRLRSWLSPDAPREAPVRSERGGYRLSVASDHVDLARFDVAADRALAGHADPADALAEWRDAPFAGAVISERLRAEQVRLVERHLLLVERTAERLLAADEPRQALEVLLPVRAATLGRERLTLLAMLAHQRLEHRQDALAAYHECAVHLREEFGLSPGRALREVHAELLAEDPPPALEQREPRVMVGRAEVLADLGRRSGLVVVSGGTGMGKSMLLRAVLDEARAHGARTGHGVWDQDDAPLSAWREAFAALGAPVREAVTGSSVHRRLAGLAHEGRLVLALDDAHRADDASLGVLRALLRRGLPAGVLLLVSVRSDVPERAWAETYADLARHDTVRHTTLGELDAEDVVALTVRRLEHLAPEAAQRVGEAVARRSGGHPMHACALLQVLREQPDEAGCHAQVETVPDALAPLLHQQVDRLPERCRRPMEALATLRPVELDVLATVLGRTTLDVLETVRPALDGGLLVELADADRLEFRHDLVADAVRISVPTTNARRWHEAALRTLPGDADPFERRRHGLGAGGLVAPRRLVELHLRAGHAAYGRGAPATALACLDDAVSHDALDARTRADVELGRGLALTALGRLAEAHDTLDALVGELETTEEQARRAAVGDGTLGAQVSGDPRRLARLRAVVARPGSGTLPAAHRMELLLALTVEETVLEGRVTTPAALPELARIAADLVDDPDPDVAVRARLVLLRATAEAPVPASHRLAEARDLARRAAEARMPANRLDAGEALISALLARGRLDEARDSCWWLRRQAREVRRPRSVWVASLVDAALALAGGEVDQADALAARAHGIGTASGLPDAAGTLQAFSMVRHWQTGTAALLGELPASAARGYPHIPAWTAAAACADVQAGRLDAAAEHLARFRERRAVLEARTFDRPALCLAAAAAFRLGDADTAAIVRANLPADPEAVVVLGIGAAIIGPATLFVALADAVLDDSEGALDHLEQAAALAGELGWTPWKEVAAAVARRIERGRGPALPLGLGEAA